MEGATEFSYAIRARARARTREYLPGHIAAWILVWTSGKRQTGCVATNASMKPHSYMDRTEPAQ